MARTKTTADKPISRRVLVTVARDMTTKTSQVVWQHELPILQEMFGEDAVQVVDPSTLDEGYSDKAVPSMLPYNKSQDQVLRPSVTQGIGFAFLGSPRAEYERLVAAYGRHKDRDEANVESVYGRFQTGRFESMLGEPELEDLPREQRLGLIRQYGFLPEANFDATKEEKAAVAQAREDLLGKSDDELLTIMKELNVELA